MITIYKVWLTGSLARNEKGEEEISSAVHFLGTQQTDDGLYLFRDAIYGNDVNEVSLKAFDYLINYYKDKQIPDEVMKQIKSYNGAIEQFN